jgi:hypothetical protein
MSIFDETNRQLALSIYASKKFRNDFHGSWEKLAEEYERYKTATPRQREKILVSIKGQR